jgi:integrase/recombinase XerD
VWLEKEEQTLQKALRNTDDLPQNIFGRTREHIKGVRVRYDFLFGLILNSGLRISEALSVRVRDVRVVNGVAKSVRVIGKGNRERLVPLPEAFGQVSGFWLNDKGKESLCLPRNLGAKRLAPMQGGAISSGSSGGQASISRSRPTSLGTPMRRVYWRLAPSL